MSRSKQLWNATEISGQLTVRDPDHHPSHRLSQPDAKGSFSADFLYGHGQSEDGEMTVTIIESSYPSTKTETLLAAPDRVVRIVMDRASVAALKELLNESED